MRTSWIIGVGAKCNDKRHHERGETQRRGDKEAEVGATKCQVPPGAGGGKQDHPLEPWDGAWPR